MKPPSLSIIHHALAPMTSKRLPLPHILVLSLLILELASGGGLPNSAFALTAQPALPDLDFGDAPDPSYPTLLASDGARHVLGSRLFLGALVDAEANGQPDPNAMGDDLKPPTGLDDEDGVVFLTPLVPGQVAQVQVTASVPAAPPGFLQAWIDYNADGDWADTGEQVFVSRPVSPGVNVFAFNVPATATPGNSFARFRLSTMQTLSYTGLALDGEVEDYLVPIEMPLEAEADLGDAPDSSNNSGLAMTAYPPGGPPGVVARYPTVYGAGSPPFGPLHRQPLALAYLGWRVSLENEADIGPDQDGLNNILPPVDTPDRDMFDDGIIQPLVLPHCLPTTFRYRMTVMTPPQRVLYLNVWADWTRDGDWDDTIAPACNFDPGTSEWAVQNQVLNLVGLPGPFPAVVTNTTPPFLPWHASSPGAPVWLRVTLSEQQWAPGQSGDPTRAGGDGPSAGFFFGETEDYYLTNYLTDTLDYGDAPDGPYPTLRASNGARHTFVPGLLLGQAIDWEADGQPNANATGDDANWVPDEDGVVFATPLVPGQPATVNVTVVGQGNLSAWLDVAADGSWAEMGDQIFSDVPLSTGTTPLTFVVPALAPGNTITFARFRFSTTANLGFLGQAPDGEVEDYEVRIEPRPQLDFGDARDPSYPTLLASDGARHVLGSGLFLGALVDAEADGQPDPNAMGDDLNPPTGLDDEDGVVFLTPLLPGQVARVQVTASVPVAPGVLQAWIDFNADGDWSDAGEQVFVNRPVLPGVNVLAFNMPAKATPGKSFARFRLSTVQALSYTGLAPDGEVEDYSVLIEKPEFDFGDAPDPTYPTLLANNGASHQLGSALYLGATVDSEADGQPDPNAMGDDLNPPTAADDEDGVQFQTALLSGVPNTVTVTSSGAGLLQGWLDANVDGDWADPGEQIIVDRPVVAGPNQITFSVPPLTGRKTFARFRLSTVAGLKETGPAADGEVEDYAVSTQPVKWVMQPDLSRQGVDVDNRSTLADDFRCTQSGPITDIHLWGSFVDDQLPIGGPTNMTVNLSLYSDVPSGPNNPYSHPGVLLWSRTFRPGEFQAGLSTRVLEGEWWHDPRTQFWRPQADFNCYQFDFYIPQPEAFRQVEGTIYWLAVRYQAGANDTFSFGWKTSGTHWNDDACWLDTSVPVPTWRDLRYGDGHPMAPDSMDLAFAITGEAGAPDLDFGDAPDPAYPTLLTSNGARHFLVPGFCLGNLQDAESDGLPNPLAQGDDLNNLDDEDGVVFATPLLLGTQACVTVTLTSYTGSGLLDAWVDFDGNGGWDTNEQVFTSRTLSAGVNTNLCFGVPQGARLGRTYARFRLSTRGNLAPTGLADSGEVEDYLVTIYQRRPSTNLVITNIVVGEFYNHGWDEPSMYRGRQIAADDWVCTNSEPVTEIIWWGSFLDWTSNVPPSPLPDAFQIAIWTDIPAAPGGAGFSHPGQVLWAVRCTNFTWQYAGMDRDPRGGAAETCFRFHQKLATNQWFYQDPGSTGTNIYWLSVAAAFEQVPALHTWGWKARPRDLASPAPDDAVRIFVPTAPAVGDRYAQGEPIYWPAPEDSWDLAFALVSKYNVATFKYGQRPDQTYYGIDVNDSVVASHLPPVYTNATLLADDWPCTERGPVTDFTVWGSWFTNHWPLQPTSVTFKLTIHADVPRSTSNPYSYPGRPLWSRTFTPGTYRAQQAFQQEEGWLNPPVDYLMPGDWTCWRYDFHVDAAQAFIQEGGPLLPPTVYWLSVQAYPPAGVPVSTFGWKTSADHWNDAAVWVSNQLAPYTGKWNELLYPPRHPQEGFPIDLAFAVGTEREFDQTKWSQPPLTNRVVKVEWNAETGVLYQVQATSSLREAPFCIWTDVGGLVLGPAHTQWETNLFLQRYFRVMAPFVWP